MVPVVFRADTLRNDYFFFVFKVMGTVKTHLKPEAENCNRFLIELENSPITPPEESHDMIRFRFRLPDIPALHLFLC
jgi:hypothetical protein